MTCAPSTTVADQTGGVCSGIAGLELGVVFPTMTNAGSNRVACFPSLHDGLHIQFISDLVEDEVKDAGDDPTPKSAMHGVPFAKHLRQVSPRGAGSADPNHPLQRHPVVVAVPTRFTRSTGQNGLDEVPLSVSQSQSHFQAGHLHMQCTYEAIVPIPEVISIGQEDGLTTEQAIRGV